MKYVTRSDIESYITRKAWEDPSFREQLISNPKAVLAGELGSQPLPEKLEVEVLEEGPDKLYLVLPMHPAEEFVGRAFNSGQFAAVSREELERSAADIRGLVTLATPCSLTCWSE